MRKTTARHSRLSASACVYVCVTQYGNQGLSHSLFSFFLLSMETMSLRRGGVDGLSWPNQNDCISDDNVQVAIHEVHSSVS